MQQPPGLDLVLGTIWKFLGHGDVAIQVLDQDFEEAVKLEEGEAGLGRRIRNRDTMVYGKSRSWLLGSIPLVRRCPSSWRP